MWRRRLSGCCEKPAVGSNGRSEPAEVDDRLQARLTIPQRIAVTLIGAYKIALSPIVFSGCKFHPTCSSYAREAIERHGVAQGSWLALKRILRCRPFAPGGIDPVPETIGSADV